MKLSKEWMLGGVLVALFIVMAIVAPGFTDVYNLTNMLFQIPELGILSLGMLVVILTSGIDLSITYLAALSGVIMAYCMTSGMPLALSILLGVLTALIGGLLNGFFVAFVGVSPILVTLGTMTFFKGIVTLITKGNSISGFPDSYAAIGSNAYFGIPLPVIIFGLIALAAWYLLNKTVWGRHVYMTGNSPIATLFSGVNTKRVIIYVYLFSAMMAAIAAVIMTSRYNSAKVDLGSSYLLQSISVAVLGGASISGGYGKVIGVVLGTAIFQVLSSGLNLMGVSSMIINILVGVVLIAVLLINFFSANMKRNELRKTT
ncbi:ABC transporter permease [Paenibacillus sp. R14(2021)]|uniref:ABC transporter permease n=1 Tax=Paenibacillus sp. R14(2021) TaxID=2859228 RepID=UPI001C616B33|nr:ABC transporter permease [Paenibacillus sp. R14(2021)]